MDDKLMYNLNNKTQIKSSADYYQWLKRLDTPLIEPTNKNLIKVPNEKKTLGIMKLWGLV